MRCVLLPTDAPDTSNNAAQEATQIYSGCSTLVSVNNWVLITHVNRTARFTQWGQGLYFIMTVRNRWMLHLTQTKHFNRKRLNAQHVVWDILSCK